MKNIFKKYKPILVITLLFIISVIVRLPTINRPLALHYEWGMAHILITLQIWEENGISNYNFNPVYTFNNYGDKFSSNIGRLPDENKNHYYTSYPPFAFYFPFFIFKILGIYPDLLPLKILNLILHLFTSILIYTIISKICNKPVYGIIFYPALISAFIYIFLPVNLWYLY